MNSREMRLVARSVFGPWQLQTMVQVDRRCSGVNHPPESFCQLSSRLERMLEDFLRHRILRVFVSTSDDIYTTSEDQLHAILSQFDIATEFQSIYFAIAQSVLAVGLSPTFLDGILGFLTSDEGSYCEECRILEARIRIVNEFIKKYCLPHIV